MLDTAVSVGVVWDSGPVFEAGIPHKKQFPHNRHVQYIPRNMHTVFALPCFVVVMHWLIYPYPSGLLHWHCGNLTIAPVPAKQPWWIWINTSFEFIMNDYITTTKQSTIKPCVYFLGYTVCTFLPAHRDMFSCLLHTKMMHLKNNWIYDLYMILPKLHIHKHCWSWRKNILFGGINKVLLYGWYILHIDEHQIHFYLIAI